MLEQNCQRIGIVRPTEDLVAARAELLVTTVQPHHHHQRRANDYCGAAVLACFVAWCCGCLFGTIAFILAGRSDYTRFVSMCVQLIYGSAVNCMIDICERDP